MKKNRVNPFGKKVILIGALILLTGCVSRPPPPPPNHSDKVFTAGNVSLTLKKGITTKEEVAKVFGAPNIVTQQGNGKSVWIYQKNSVETHYNESSTYLTLIIFGTGKDQGGSARSDRSMTLMIYFNEKGVVTNFKSQTTSF